MIVESAEEFRALVSGLFERLASCVSFAGEWIDRFLDLQKLS